MAYVCVDFFINFCAMGKLGKKARKFAKKNLQSVLKRKRKMKPMFKKKSSSKLNFEHPIWYSFIISRLVIF